MTDAPVLADGSSGAIGLRISNDFSKLHHDFFGRGPAGARTLIGRDHVVVFLHDVYIKSERTLIDAGESQAVDANRQAFQRTMEKPFVIAVEAATGRRVAAYMSQNHQNPDVAVEIFVLERETSV